MWSRIAAASIGLNRRVGRNNAWMHHSHSWPTCSSCWVGRHPSIGGQSHWEVTHERARCTRASDIDDINREMEQLFGKQANQEDLQASLTGGAPISGVSKPANASVETKVKPLKSDGDKLTHIDGEGNFHMVDVGHKDVTKRMATASARVCLEEHVFQMVAQDKLQKGNVLSIAEVAGIQAAKRTSDLIPLCHNIQLNKVHVECKLQPEHSQVLILSTAQTQGTTGVEMEALTAVSVAALTIYDMCKAASKGTKITDIALERKSGGKSGDYIKEANG